MILFFKMDFSVLSGARIYLENRNGCVIESRFCNHNCHLIIITDRGWALLLLLDEEAPAEVRINISLTRQLRNVISVIKPDLGFHFHI